MLITIDHGEYTYDTAPDTCPLCHHGIEPRIIGSNCIDKGKIRNNRIQILYRCPRQVCQRAFIGTYRQLKDIHGLPENHYTLWSTAPYSSEAAHVPEEIKLISDNFVEIYSQAHNAEHYELDQIAGVGYRKAMEFLIKDYCISKHEKETDEIKKKFLGACIDEYIGDANIKACAKRATWLGNDETHYVRKWEDKDIADLKILIELTMAWIRNEVLTEQYMADMDIK